MIYINSESSLADSSTYSHLQKKTHFSHLPYTLYFYIPVSGQLQLWAPFLRPEGVRSQELPLYTKSRSGSVTSSLASTQGQNTQYKTFCDLVVKNPTSFLQFLSQIKTLKQSACFSIVTIRKPVPSQGICIDKNTSSGLARSS